MSSLGNFLVEDIVFLEPQPVIPITPRRISGVNWLALVSGLGFISYSGSAIPESYDRHLMSLTLLADWLREGEWARLSSSDVSTSISNCCLMILGDSIRAGHDGSCETLANCVQAKQARHLTFKLEAEGVAAMASFDAWLASLPLGGFNQNLLAKNLHEDVLACIGYTEKVNEVGHMESGSGGGLCVHLLPGPHDAVSCLMPQQPIHAATLPKSVDRVGSGKSGLRGVTNPHLCRVAGRRVLATSGQNSQQLAMYTDLADDLDRMEASLHWGHLAPTCPDSLLGYPLSDCDPLLMRFPPADSSIAFNSIDYPDIYVSATGQSEVKQPVWRRANLFPHLTATKQGRGTSEVVTAEGALLVSVPRFDMSHCIALVDLDSLDCHIVHFDVDSTC
ncbi:unnamed protein product [Protopolystoma xenopodis]|uniref:DNA polymerase alpha/delta/epsilon subunit B domain-containing protein n=1 Tax=Protopolystoma xenopodis TaxID=117903 RepID=A0A448WQL4_9PLAT|nr:unnamed protein product [Protopolystoma xenopodis]